MTLMVTNDANMDHCGSTEYLYRWLEPTRHAESLPKGKFFVMTYGRILDEDYSVQCPFFKSEENMLYADDNCTIYGFESMEDYKTALSKLNN